MGTLIPSNGRVLQYGQRGKLVYHDDAEAQRKIPGLNQQTVSYTDTDGKNKWAGVDTDDFGGVLYGGRRFANAQDLVSTLLTPVTPTPAPTVTTPQTPQTSTPVSAFRRTAPQVSAPENLRDSPAAAPVRTVANYGAKALTGVGAAFANLAGRVARTAEERQELGVRALDTLTDAAAQRYLQADDSQKDKALKTYQTRLALRNQVKNQPETAQNLREALYGISDELAAASGKFQAAAEKNLPDVPLLKGALNTVTNLVPFFALNAVPGGQIAAGAYLVGEATGDARRAGLSEQSQAALGLMSLLSMGAAGQVGKAIGNPEVTRWFLKNGMGPELARVLEQAAVSGLATGATRQTVMAGGQLYAHAEQVKTAQANLEELSKMDISGFSPERKAAYDSAVAANQAVISSGGVDFTAALTGIALEMFISIGGAGIRYAFNRGKQGPNFQTSEPVRKNLKPEESEYFQGVRTPEEAKARLRSLVWRYHPDVSDNPDATGIMQTINDEFDRLILDAERVTRTWRKAKSGQGVTKAEADAANRAVSGLLQTARASGDAETVTAMERILAPLAAEINAAPVVPEIPLAPQGVSVPDAAQDWEIDDKLRILLDFTPQVPQGVAVPDAVETAQGVAVPNAVEKAPPVAVSDAVETAPPVAVSDAQPAPVAVNAPITTAPTQFPAANLPAFEPVPERKPFITFEAWRKQYPEAVTSADAKAREELSALTAVDKNPGFPKNKRGEPSATVPAAPQIPTPETPSAPVTETPSAAPQVPTPETPSAPVTQSAAPVTETPSATLSGPMRELVDGLNASDRVEIANIRFEIIRAKDYAVAQIRRIDPQETPYIKNAANDIWRDFLPTPDAARDALISIARTFPSFAVDNAPLSGYAVGQTDAQGVPENPEEVTKHDGQRTLADVPDGEGVPQSPVLRDVASGLDGAVETERGQAHEGAGDARGVHDGSGGEHHGISGGQLQHAGPVGGTGNHAGSVLRGAGAGRGQLLGNHGLDETPPPTPEVTPTQSPTPKTSEAAAPETETPTQPEVSGTGNPDAPQSPTPETASPGGTSETASGKPSKKTARKKRESVKPDAKPAGTDAETEQSPATETRKTDKSPATEAEASTPETRTETEIEEKTERAAAPKGRDFTFPEGGLQLPNGAKSRARANLAAVEILRTLESEGRPATAEEQDALSKFVGWGGLSDIFDKRKPEWETLRGQLKNLLSDEEYAAAEKSTLNAHYTSHEVIKGVYAALEHIGFQGGRVLEPAAGIGHFNGAMPANLRGKSRWTMVELDPVTGGIAKALYPNADVRAQGFENALLPDNYFDAAISNVPFGDIRIVDKHYPSFITHSIHNYFFAKALDKVRPGGIVAFITSRYTMDSYQSDVRKWLSGKADLLGAVRLPDTAFKSNAGTDVVTDILLLRKRAPDTPYAGEKFIETNYRAFQSREGWVNGYINQYFEKHPEMVLGVMDKGSMYRGDGLTWKPKDTTKSLTEQIIAAFSTVTEKMSYPVRRTQEDIRAEIRADAAKGKVGGLVRRDGKIYRNDNGKLVEATDIPKTQRAKTEAVIAMRDAARALLDFQASGAPQEQIDNSRKGLNAMYDDFVKKYGPLHENRSVIMRDTDGPFIMSLEKYDKDTKTATKADIFFKDTLAPNVTATHADSVEDALTICLNETGAVSAERIAALTGDAPEAVTKLLLENGLAFLNRDGNLETAEQYLSGNVRAKLRDAQALAEGNPEYRRNVEALKKIIPPDIQAEDIKAQIGATWIPDEVYSAFASQMAGGHNATRVTYNKTLGEYRLTITDSWVRKQLKTAVGNTTKWGTKDRTFLEIFAATLNNKDLNVWRKTADGGRILDQDATAAVKQKAHEIQAEFQDWLFRNPERRDALVRLYNNVHNNSVTPRYDGSKLEISGMNTNVTLNPHQKNAVWRIINSGGNTLLAHRVGAGKTYEMAAAAMKLRQLGIVKKPMFVVPKSLTGQWAREFLDLFPNAKILAPGDDFSAVNRKEYVNRIATGDYDAVILSYEQFKAIPMSAESRAGFIKEQIDRLEAALEEEARNGNGRSPSVKQMAKKKANLEAELKKLMDKKEDADNINFEALGADALFVDEAHNFKNLFYTTHMSNVTGLGNKEGSQQAFDLYMKIRYLQRLNGGRGVVFATATPVMNSLVEMYTMQTYLQPDALEARGIYNFDAWANQFAEVRTELQISPSGQGGRMKDTLSRYNNLQALQQMFSQCMDVVTEIPGLKIPKMKGGKRIVIECEASERQREEMQVLAKRAEDLKGRKVDPKVDNILKIGMDGRKLSYSQHMIDPSLPYEPDGKIMKCAENVFRVWKETSAKKGTQIIFCDYFTPAGGAVAAKGAEEELVKAEAALDAQAEKEAITLYQDVKNILVGMGIPAKEIAFIHDAKNVEQRNQLFDKMRAGKVRVLMGSTGKMGVGMNVQNRAVAEHHLDAPQRPGDVEQREGRVLRQGNQNEEVAIYVYITKNTFDARAWDILQRKWTFIVQLTSGDFTGNSFEGDSDVLSAAEIKAIASGNPLIQEQFQITADIATLEGLERAHRRETFAAQDRLKAARAAIAADTDTAARLRADIDTRRDTSGKAFSVTLDGKSVTERKAAGERLIQFAQKFLKPGQGPETTKKIGTFAGFDLLATSGGDLILRGRGQYRATVNFSSATGTVQALEAAVRKLDSTLSDVEGRLAANREAVPELEKASTAPFAKADELEQKRKRQAEILIELSDDRKPSGDAQAATPDAGNASGTPKAKAATPQADAFRESASGTPQTSAFKEAAPAWEITEDENGVLRFRDTAPKDKAATMGNHPERWTADRVGDADAQPGRIAEIIRKYSQGWSRHVTVGHVRGARGQYQRQGTGIGSGGIRLKQANDLPVFVHEIGHAISDGYQLTEPLKNFKSGLKEGSLENPLSKEEASERIATIRLRMDVAKELKDNLDPQFAAQYENDQLIDEGMAEFFRRFCQNRLTAAADYPETYRYVMTTLSGVDQTRLLAMADEVNAVYALDAETAQSSIRRMDEKAVDYRGMPEKFSNALDKLIQKTVDSLHPVKKLSQMMGSDVYKKFYNAAYADSMAHFILTTDLRDLDGQYKGPGLRTVLSRINVNDAKEFDAFGEYLIVRNAPSWIADDKRVLADDRKNNLLYCELREKELERQYPQFKAASEALYKFWDKFMKIYVVETGLISREQYDAMRDKHPYYVPFRRVMSDVIAASKGFGTHRTFASQPNPIKKAIGSGRDIIHPVESMINSVAKFVYQGVHQRCMLELIDTANAYGLDAAFMERVPAPLAKQTADISGVKAEIAQRVGNSNLPEKAVELLLKVLDEEDDIMSWYVPRQLLPENCIGVRRNGEVEVYKINDPLLFDALANMGRPLGFENNAAYKFFNDITRKVSSMLTGYNITWSIFSNAPRDIQTALISTKSGDRVKLLFKTADSYLSAIAKARDFPSVDPFYMEYLALGGGGSSAWAMDTKLPKKVLSEIQPAKGLQNPVKQALQGIEFLSRTIEAGPRAATYIMCRKNGMDAQSAFRAAMEVTVDFRKGGYYSRLVNAFMPFFNAGVQGMVKDVDMLTRAGKAGLITYLVASLIGAAIEYALNGMTDERRKSYSRLSTYTKNSYYCIPIGDGKYFGIPKARGMLIPENLFRAALERNVGGNRHAFDGFWGYAATAEFPNGLSDVIQLNPSSFFGSVTILGPVAQIWANADFRGMPIESARDRKLSPRERYTGSTSALAKNLGAALNLSPKQIDFFGNNTLGAAWQYQRALFPVDASKRDMTLGVQGKYVKDSLYSQDSVNRLYDLAEKSSRDSMDDVTDMDSKVTAYFDSAMTTFYSRYNSIARSEDDSSQSDRATRELVLTLMEDYLTAREDGTLTAEQETVYAVCRAAGDTERMLPSARQNTVKDGDGTVHNLTAAQYYDYQGNFNSVYWALVKEALPQVRTDAEREAVLKSALEAAGEMAKNNALMKLGAATTKEYKRYEDLQLYSVPVSTYLVAAAKTKDIESLKDRRAGDTIRNSKSALIAEAVREMELDLPETNLKMLMSKLGVSDTVLGWSERKLARELRDFRKDAGME